ncbi:MAG: nitrilase-related carbon-nitrogen hydrolase, partial [Angustibacter sp.]
MPQLRLALAQVNPTLGDIAGNRALVRQWTARAAQQQAHLVVFPEMVLTGYPVEDLALRRSFVDASRAELLRLAADLVADGLGELPVILGYLDRVDGPSPGRGPKGLAQNCAAVLHRGAIIARYAKHHLPNYGVFDEFRIFVPGEHLTVVRIQGIDVALAICEDLWQDGGPVATTRAAGAELLLVLNGSPFEQHKHDVRGELARNRAREADCTLAYVNLVGGQDELVFDGGSFIVSADGTLLARARQFEEQLLVTDLDLAMSTVQPGPWLTQVEQVRLSEGPVPPYPARLGESAPTLNPTHLLWQALTLGLRDYVRKNGFTSVLLGLSGGIDSAVVAALAADA